MTSATQITYFHLCHRKLWLHTHDLKMEHNSHAVAEGKLIEKTSYQRRSEKWKQLAFDGVKIDHFDPAQKLVREVKKSPKLEHAHVAQVKYYLYALKQRGVLDARGLIEYPKHRKTTRVELEKGDPAEIEKWEKEIKEIIALKTCPPIIKKSYCKNCAFYDFCFI